MEIVHAQRIELNKIGADLGMSIGNKRNFSELEIQTLIHHYVDLKQGLILSGASIGVSQKVAKRILKEQGIKIRSYEEAKQALRKYELDDDFFKKQNPDMAYILGFIAADGNVAKNENNISIQLLTKDKDILEKIKVLTKSSRPLDQYITKNGQDTTKFSVFSAEWKKDLKVYGVMPAKTFILQPPLFLQKKYWIDYIRGYFDGDGTIYKTTGCNNRFEIAGASKEVIQWIRTFLASEYGITCTLSEENRSNGTKMFKVIYSDKEKITLLYHLFYDNKSLYLKRKKEKFEAILKIPRDSVSSEEEDKKLC